MQFSEAGNGRQVPLKDPPDLNGKVLTTGKFALHKININIQILVIQFIDHLGANQGAEALQIDHKAGFRVRRSLNGYDELKIVAMPVFIRAGAKDFSIPFFRPLRVVELVGGVKVFFSGNVEHVFSDISYGKPKILNGFGISICGKGIKKGI
jgi:hypothetical protein